MTVRRPVAAVLAALALLTLPLRVTAQETPVEAPPSDSTAPAASSDVPPAVTVLEPEASEVLQAAFALVVNHVEHGLILAVLAGDDIWVNREDLALAGLSSLGGRDEMYDGAPWLSLKSVSPPLRFELDETAIAVRIFAPPDLLPRQVIDVGEVPTNVEYQTRTAGFMNYSARADSTGGLELYTELGASHDGNLAFSSTYLSSVRGPIRGLTHYTINERETLRRFTIGDAHVQTGPLGGATFMGGFTLERAWDLNPYAIVAPAIGFTAATSAPATLEVYVNGALARREQVAPGVVELRNLRVGGGAGTATYVLRDVFGAERTITLPFYVSGNVLAKGLDEFSYSLGAVRRSVSVESWDYGRPALLARHRWGITNQVTVGGRAEASERLVSGGPGVTTFTPLGRIELEVGGSREAGGHAGLASFASYSYWSRKFGAGAQVRHTTNAYSTLSLPARADRITLDLGGFAGLPLFERASVSSNVQYWRFRDTPPGFRVGTTASTRLWSAFMLMASAGVVRTGLGQNVWDAFIGLSYIHGRSSVTGFARTLDGQAGVGVSASRSLPVAGHGYGFALNARLEERNAVFGLAQYQTPAVRLGATYNFLGGNDTISSNQLAVAELAGALVVVPGIGISPALPVQDGFGIIRFKGLKGVRGYVNHQEAGATNRRGILVVPALLSYYGNRLSIAPDDIPMTYVLETEEMVLAPPQRGVVVADFPVFMPHYYRGTIAVLQGEHRLNVAFGQLTVQTPNGPMASALADKGEFELDGLRPGTQQGTVEFSKGVCEFTFDAPDRHEVVIDLGELVCVMPSEVSD
jgi:outer membrane usher protein